jgi:hypothetical protein
MRNETKEYLRKLWDYEEYLKNCSEYQKTKEEYQLRNNH